jgi:hypothetical protein
MDRSGQSDGRKKEAKKGSTARATVVEISCNGEVLLIDCAVNGSHATGRYLFVVCTGVGCTGVYQSAYTLCTICVYILYYVVHILYHPRTYGLLTFALQCTPPFHLCPFTVLYCPFHLCLSLSCIALFISAFHCLVLPFSSLPFTFLYCPFLSTAARPLALQVLPPGFYLGAVFHNVWKKGDSDGGMVLSFIVRQ